MGKLSPPLVEGTIPAFYSENGAAKIVVPFSMNRAVSKVQVDGIAIKIKTVQSSSYLYDAEVTDAFYYNLEDSPWAEFINIPAEKFRVGQFYKVQIAYIEKGTGDIGYYSTAAIIKYTSKPDLYIYDVEQGPINSHLYEYKGIYHQSQDASERVYSYRFDVYDPNDNLILTSGDMIHNHADDTELDESYDTYLFSQDLEVGAIYKIQYTVTTNNLLTLSTPRYRIMQKPSINPEIKASLNVALNYDNGYIKVNLIGEKIDGMEEPVTGAFLLTRACEDTGYAVWEEVSRFKLAGQIPSRQLWRDFTVEQGKHYQYSL
ncbi:MAG: hypothetical protein IJ341_10385 [Bacteroidales bacterium]|nr:hypothetical protein [Bacteroidales bacterium]